MAATTSTLNFQYKVLKRMLAIAPRRSKKIKLLYVEYAYTEKGTSRIMKYRFRNALWYTVNNTNTTHTRIPLSEDEIGTEINLTVHGFFRRNIYTLLLKPDYIHVIKIVHA